METGNEREKGWLGSPREGGRREDGEAGGGTQWGLKRESANRVLEPGGGGDGSQGGAGEDQWGEGVAGRGTKLEGNRGVGALGAL